MNEIEHFFSDIIISIYISSCYVFVKFVYMRFLMPMLQTFVFLFLFLSLDFVSSFGILSFIFM